MPLLVGKELGSERIAYEALILLRNNLTTALAVEEAKWATLDTSLAALLGIDYVPCNLDEIQPENFYLGHVPSLIEAPVTGYPNVSVMSDQVIPSAFQADHYSGLSVNLLIEALVIDGPYDNQATGFNRVGEELVNRKVQRTAEAINSVITSNRTLGGIVQPIVLPPRVIFSECFVRRELSSYGADYYWQGVNLAYVVDKVEALYE